MRKVRLLLSIVSLLAGAGIVIISLSAVSPVLSSEPAASHKRFYFNEPILPDHVAYPLFMVADRMALEAAPADQKVDIELEYGLRRLEYAQQLLDKGDVTLALTTLTKSQKYILQAAHQVLDNASSTEAQKEQVLKVLIKYSDQADELAAKFPDRSAVDQLLKECEALQLQLRTAVGK